MEKIGHYSYLQESGQKLTTDSLALTGFLLPLRREDTVIDLGTGTGCIPLILALKTPVEKIVGVDVEKSFSDIARINVLANGLSSRISVLEEDFRKLPEIYPEGSFSVVVSNPPYMKAWTGRTSPRKDRGAARCETHAGLRDLVRVSGYLAGSRGRIFYVFTVRRLEEMMAELKGAGLKPERLEFVRTGKVAKIFLVEARRF